MDNQQPSPASTPVTPAGNAYVPPAQSNQSPPTPPPPPTTPPPAQTSPPASLSSAPPPPTKKSSLPMILGLLVLLLLLGGGAYYYMNMQQKPVAKPVQKMQPIPTKMPTATPMATDSATASVSADWKTYTNEKNGYSLKYPTDTLERLQCPDEEFDLNEKHPGVQSVEGTPLPTCGRDGRYLIEGKTYAAAYTLPDFTDHYDVTTQAFTINGYPATRYTFVQTTPYEGPGLPTWFQEVLIKTNSKTYEFYLDNQKHQQVFDQILSTFTITQ